MFQPAAWAVTWCGILYPWILPALAEVDFAVAGSHSISAFIETPSATAAMASFFYYNKLEAIFNNILL